MQPLTKRSVRKILGATWHQTQTFLHHQKIVSPKCREKFPESTVPKKLFNEFSRIESRKIGALSRFDEFPLKPLLPGHSGSAPETSQNAPNVSRVTNENNSQGDHHHEATVSQSRTTNVYSAANYNANGGIKGFYPEKQRR